MYGNLIISLVSRRSYLVSRRCLLVAGHWSLVVGIALLVSWRLVPDRGERDTRCEIRDAPWCGVHRVEVDDSPSGYAITSRDLRFEFDPRRAGCWHPAGAHVAHWNNAFSLFLPAGEAF